MVHGDVGGVADVLVKLAQGGLVLGRVVLDDLGEIQGRQDPIEKESAVESATMRFYFLCPGFVQGEGAQ